MNRLTTSAVFALCLSQVFSASGQLATYQDPSWQRYQSLVKIADLQTKPSEPFLLKVEYQLYDLDGNPTVKGTAEEVWGQTSNPHLTIQSPTLQMDDAESADKLLLHHTRESYLVHQMLAGIVHPLPFSANRLDFILKRSQQTVAGVALSCLSVGRAGVELARTQVFCTDADNQLLSVAGEGPSLIQRSNFTTYRDKKVPMDITISYRDKPAIKAHVTQLDALTPSAGAVTATDGEPSDYQITPGQVLARISPSYPIAAKLTHSSGLVLLTARITKDGHVAGLDVISSSSPALSKAALDAAKKWTYTPYKLKGQPVEAEEIITVDFNFASN
jgi:TonB family protein